MSALASMRYPEPIIVDIPEHPEVMITFSDFQDAAVSVVPLEKLQRAYVKYVLARCGGNITHAAKHLGISRRSIQRWARQDGIR